MSFNSLLSPSPTHHHHHYSCCCCCCCSGGSSDPFQQRRRRLRQRNDTTAAAAEEEEEDAVLSPPTSPSLSSSILWKWVIIMTTTTTTTTTLVKSLPRASSTTTTTTMMRIRAVITVFLLLLLLLLGLSQPVAAATTAVVSDLSSLDDGSSSRRITVMEHYHPQYQLQQQQQQQYQHRGLQSTTTTPPPTATAATSSSSSQLPPLRFALVPKSLENAYFLMAKDGCIDQAATLTLTTGRSVNCSYVGPEKDNEDIDGRLQAEFIASLIDRRLVDGIAVSVRNASYITPVVDQAAAVGIPVVTFDSDAPLSKRFAYIGTDNFFFGGQIAKVLKQLQPNGGTYALFTSIESPNLQERVRGFQETMNRTDGKVWKELPGSPVDIESSIDVAIQKMHVFANLTPPPTALVPVMGAPMRSGGWKDFVTQHRAKGIILVSGDAMTNQLELLDRGYVSGLVGQLPYEMGKQSIDTLYQLLTTTNQSSVQGGIIGTNVLSHLLIPLILPPHTINNNLIGNLNIVGLVLFGLVALASIGFAIWVMIYRNLIIVKAAQPSFLIMVAMGMLVLAASIVPLGFDDHGQSDSLKPAESIAICMSVPWLGSTGFTISFSALFAKTMRVNKIFHNKSQFSRVRVTPQDVALPLFTLLIVNTLLLALWTHFDPLQYKRVDLPGTDGWNRVVATYGSCQSEYATPYIVPLALVNMGVLVAANWQAYEARYIESEFAESKYIAMAMASLLQAMLSGIPILFVVRESPQAYYLVMTFMIFIICAAVLLLIFVPKIILAQSFIGRSEGSQRRLIQGAIRKQAATTQSRQSQGNISGLSDSLRPGGSHIMSNVSGLNLSGVPAYHSKDSSNSSKSQSNDRFNTTTSSGASGVFLTSLQEESAECEHSSALFTYSPLKTAPSRLGGMGSPRTQSSHTSHSPPRFPPPSHASPSPHFGAHAATRDRPNSSFTLPTSSEFTGSTKPSEELVPSAPFTLPKPPPHHTTTTTTNTAVNNLNTTTTKPPLTMMMMPHIPNLDNDNTTNHATTTTMRTAPLVVHQEEAGEDEEQEEGDEEMDLLIKKNKSDHDEEKFPESDHHHQQQQHVHRVMVELELKKDHGDEDSDSHSDGSHSDSDSDTDSEMADAKRGEDDVDFSERSIPLGEALGISGTTATTLSSSSLPASFQLRKVTTTTSSSTSLSSKLAAAAAAPEAAPTLPLSHSSSPPPQAQQQNQPNQPPSHLHPQYPQKYPYYPPPAAEPPRRQPQSLQYASSSDHDNDDDNPAMGDDPLRPNGDDGDRRSSPPSIMCCVPKWRGGPEEDASSLSSQKNLEYFL